MLHLRLLGGTSLRLDDGTPVDGLATQPSRFALLAYLALRRDALVRRDELLAIFWPELDEARARNALSQALHVLRKSVGAEAIVTRGMDVGVDAAFLTCDAAELERLAADGQNEDAADLYAGELMPAFNLNGVPDFERWLDGRRGRLRELAARSAARAADAAHGHGELARAVRYARRAVDIALDERSVRRLMTLLDESGDRAAALRAYQEFARRLADDLGLAPSAETQALAEKVSRVDGEAPAAEGTRRSFTSPRTTNEVHAPLTNEVHATLTNEAYARLTNEAASPGMAANAARRSFASRRRTNILLGAALVVVAAVTTALIARRSSAEHAPAAVRVAVLPFQVFATHELAYLAGGMMDVLSLDMDGVGPVRTIDPHAVGSDVAKRDTTDRVALGVASARALGADRFVLGSVIVTGSRARVTATLYDAAGQAVSTSSTDVAQASDVLTATDGIARELLASELPASAQGLSRLAALTSPSTKALRLYLEGERAYREGRFDVAVESFGAAVREDTSFALGNYRLAESLDWGIHMWDGKQQLFYVQRAMRHMEALGPRERRVIEAQYEFWNGSPQRAASLYRSVTVDHPDDVDAWAGLAEVTFHYLVWMGGSPDASREPFERLLQLDPENASANVHLARLAALRGDSIASDSLARRALVLAPKHDARDEMLLLSALSVGDAGARARAMELVRATAPKDGQKFDPGWYTAWRIATFREDPVTALSIASALTDARRPAFSRLQGELLAVNMAAALGRFDDVTRHLSALERIDARYAQAERISVTMFGPFARTPARLAALSAPPVIKGDRGAESQIGLAIPEPPYAAGLVALARNDSAGVAAAVRATEAFQWEDGSPTHLDALTLEARWIWQAKSAAAALEYLEQHWSSISPGHQPVYQTNVADRMLRADLLRAAGRDREAIQWYHTVSEDLGGGIMFAAPAHLGAARSYVRLGDRARARLEYARVVALWAGADAEFGVILGEARGVR